jgi:acyl-CoA thioester hydrolase
MDAFGHVNHAKTVTLLEEARASLLFTEAARHDVFDMARGIVVAKLLVDYHAPLGYTGSEIVIKISVCDLKPASFTLDYTVHADRNDDSPALTSAQTLMVPYDFSAERPRRLQDKERDFLAAWHNGGSVNRGHRG